MLYAYMLIYFGFRLFHTYEAIVLIPPLLTCLRKNNDEKLIILFLIFVPFLGNTKAFDNDILFNLFGTSTDYKKIKKLNKRISINSFQMCLNKEKEQFCLDNNVSVNT